MCCLVFSTQSEGPCVVQWLVCIFWAFSYIPILGSEAEVDGKGKSPASFSLPLGSKRNVSKRKVWRKGRK